LVGMSVVAAWIALFADPNRCRGGVLGCRAAFGVGAVITTFMAAVALRQWLAGSTRRSGP
ncbi:MAG TPA: hypothetical protein VFJ74_01505, partial [Gemmatimonadaceae bacterium]|nr:hypothetical protein [Gemmatimonadaceae bacterium]